MYRYKQSFGELHLLEFEVIRTTPAGKWIKPAIGTFSINDYGKRFVKNVGKKRFAYETKEAALINFIKRTERHIMFAKSNIKSAEQALYQANKLAALDKGEEKRNGNL